MDYFNHFNENYNENFDEDEDSVWLRNMIETPYQKEPTIVEQQALSVFNFHLYPERYRTLEEPVRTFVKARKPKATSISEVPLFITWTVDPKKQLSYDFIKKAYMRKLRSLIQSEPKKLIFSVEHLESNMHVHMFLLSSQKLRSEMIQWNIGKVNKQIAKGDDQEIKAYLCKENPYCDLSGLSEAEAMSKSEKYFLDLF